jgi:hypothetical protein
MLVAFLEVFRIFVVGVGEDVLVGVALMGDALVGDALVGIALAGDALVEVALVEVALVGIALVEFALVGFALIGFALVRLAFAGLAFVGILVGGAVLALVESTRCSNTGSADFRRFVGGVEISGVCSTSERFLLLGGAWVFIRDDLAAPRGCFDAAFFFELLGVVRGLGATGASVVTGDGRSHDGRNFAGVNSCRYFS